MNPQTLMFESHDDHPAIIQGVEFMLSGDPDSIHFAGSAENVPDALEQLSDLDVGVILLDLFISSTQPVDNLHRIRGICPESAVVIYSAEDSTRWKYKMFYAGAKVSGQFQIVKKSGETDVPPECL